MLIFCGLVLGVGFFLFVFTGTPMELGQKGLKYN